MRPLSLLLFCLTFAFAQEAPKVGMVSGRVVHGVTGEPVRKATVTLTLQRTTLQGTTGADGAFVIAQVPAGEYRLVGIRTGFLRGTYPYAVKVDAGQSMTGLELRLLPQGVVTGRVVDEDGEPVERATVAVIAAKPSARRRGGTQAAQTNDLGEFRITQVTPGKYLVMVRRDNTVVGPGRNPDGSMQEFGYPVTYYPAAREESSAAPVTLTPGQDVTGLVIPLRRSSIYRIRGRVQGMEKGGEREGYQVMVGGRESAGGGGRGGMGPGSGRVRPDGTFETVGVAPGSYSLTLLSFQKGPPVKVGRATVEVGNAPAEGVVLFAGAPLKVSGQIRFDATTTAKLGDTKLWLGTSVPGPGYAEATVKVDGSFELRRVGRDKFQISVTPPAGTYVKSVSVAGQEVLLTGLDLSAADAVAPVDVVLGTKPATVSGRVKDATTGVVWLIGADPNGRITAKVDAQGQFSQGGLAPGEYRAIALESAEMVTDFDEDAQRRAQGKFEKLKVTESETASVTLTLVTQKEMESGN
ncbi:MAG: carboxypeptidase-like regulatory domain-containing protein [Acidobacteria bacterium]|nr:carboxypeptidase-like regulatory domain-containing protein [Acidobacteriota bacterium]